MEIADNEVMEIRIPLEWITQEDGNSKLKSQLQELFATINEKYENEIEKNK
jgi:hypothetical protein